MNKEEISKKMSELARMRKNPYLPFKDKNYATKMGRLGGKATAKKNETDNPGKTTNSK